MYLELTPSQYWPLAGKDGPMFFPNDPCINVLLHGTSMLYANYFGLRLQPYEPLHQFSLHVTVNFGFSIKPTPARFYPTYHYIGCTPAKQEP